MKGVNMNQQNNFRSCLPSVRTVQKFSEMLSKCLNKSLHIHKQDFGCLMLSYKDGRTIWNPGFDFQWGFPVNWWGGYLLVLSISQRGSIHGETCPGTKELTSTISFPQPLSISTVPPVGTRVAKTLLLAYTKPHLPHKGWNCPSSHTCLSHSGADLLQKKTSFLVKTQEFWRASVQQ